MEEKLLKIINTYGVNNQQRKLNEEVFELQEAIVSYETKEPYLIMTGRQHIAEELADCMVLLSQFKEYYHIDGKEIMDIMNNKIDRQLDRIANEVQE